MICRNNVHGSVINFYRFSREAEKLRETPRFFSPLIYCSKSGLRGESLVLAFILFGEPDKGEMSAYENVVAGKLRLKGKALDVRDGSIKKKRKHKKRQTLFSGAVLNDQLADGNNALVRDLVYSDVNGSNMHNGGEVEEDERLTPAERRYLQRLEKIELQRFAKTAKKSHRDRIHEFNQYLANLTEHYDIPKVGPG